MDAEIGRNAANKRETDATTTLELSQSDTILDSTKIDEMPSISKLILVAYL